MNTPRFRNRLAASLLAATSLVGVSMISAGAVHAAPVTLTYADENGNPVEMVVDDAIFTGSPTPTPVVATTADLPANLQWVVEADGEGNAVLVLIDLNNFKGTPFASVASAALTVADGANFVVQADGDGNPVLVQIV